MTGDAKSRTWIMRSAIVRAALVIQCVRCATVIERTVFVERSVRRDSDQSPLMSRGMNGIIGDGNLPTFVRYALWFRLGSMSASYSVNCFRDFDGNLSHVVDSRLTATSLNPIRIAKNALKLLYSLQLKNEMRTCYLWSYRCNIVIVHNRHHARVIIIDRCRLRVRHAYMYFHLCIITTIISLMYYV